MDITTIYEKFKSTSGPVTDTRKELRGKMFFALKGPNFNGNEYADKAIELGAKYVVVDAENRAQGSQFIMVNNVLETLQQLGHYHKKQINIPVIGITGTNGKTTSKELLHQILSSSYRCYATQGNLNNQIGVPFSLLEIQKDTEIAIIEMGANKLGDIKELCQIADPDYGFITNIGIAHLEGFLSKANITKEKGELFNYIKRKKAPFFVNSSETEVVNLVGNYENRISIGEGDTDDYVFELLQAIPSMQIKYKGKVFESSLYGEHNYENIKMALAIGLYLNIGPEVIQQALPKYRPNNNRSQLIEKSGIKIFMDAYNANPSSMRSSIESFASFNVDFKVLILGDMLEMGDQSLDFHREILEVVNKYTWKDVLLVGQEFCQLQDGYKDFHFFKETQEADEYLNQPFPNGAHILIKGSRGKALEKMAFIQELI